MLHALIAPLRHRATTGPTVNLHRQAGLAHQSVGAACPDDTCSEVTFDGRLDNRQELTESLSIASASSDLSDAALVWMCYRRFGETFATYLNGDFALALWDASKHQLVLARDLIGVRPLDHWTSGTTFIAASEIKAILAHPDVDPRPDDDGLADAVLGGNPNDNRLTCFRDVRRMLPGSTVVVMADRLREFRHRDFDPARQTHYGSITEYAEVLRGLFEQAVRRRLRPVAAGPVAVLVSGGLDSSAILCQGQMLTEAAAPVAPTVGVSWIFPDGTPADEKKTLAAVEGQHPVTIHRVPFREIRLLDEEPWLRTLEFPRLRWDSEVLGLAVARQHGCHAVLDGYFGDQIMSSDATLFELARSFRVFKLHREFNALAESAIDCPRGDLLEEYAYYFLWEIAPEPLLRAQRAVRRVLGWDGRPRWFSHRFRALAYQRSQQQRRVVRRFAGKQAEWCHRLFVPTHRLNFVEELNKLANAHGLERAYPFMDRDLVEFMMSIPGHIVSWEGKHKGLFREAMRGVLPESIRRRYWKADFTAVADAAAISGIPRFRTHFESGCLSAAFGYIDRDIFAARFRSYRGELTGASTQLPNQVSDVVGLELWLRAFFGDARHDRLAPV